MDWYGTKKRSLQLQVPTYLSNLSCTPWRGKDSVLACGSLVVPQLGFNRDSPYSTPPPHHMSDLPDLCWTLWPWKCLNWIVMVRDCVLKAFLVSLGCGLFVLGFVSLLMVSVPFNCQWMLGWMNESINQHSISQSTNPLINQFIDWSNNPLLVYLMNNLLK